jgi:hypothetical protein
MERQTKIILIVSGSIIVATALGFGIYFLVTKNSEDEETETNPFVETDSSKTSSESNTDNDYQPLITPTFNTENELSNSMVQLRGEILYPKEKNLGGWDYTNVRSSAEVNTDQGWWDTGNKITTIYKGNGIGKVISETTSVLGGYSYRWFKVRLLTNIDNHTVGYVRGDTVTFKSIF